jgi:hypothetical protein
MEAVEYPFAHDTVIDSPISNIEDPQQKMIMNLIVSINELRDEVCELRNEVYDTKLRIKELAYMNYQLARMQSDALTEYIEEYKEMDQEERGRLHV